MKTAIFSQIYFFSIFGLFIDTSKVFIKMGHNGAYHGLIAS